MPDARAVLSSAPAGIVTPGQRIAQAVGFQAGQGCYIAPDGCIYASVVGLKRELPVVVAAAEGSATPEMEADGRNVVEVSMLTEPTMQPTLDDLVTARVTKINPRYASLEILLVKTFQKSRCGRVMWPVRRGVSTTSTTITRSTTSTRSRNRSSTYRPTWAR